MIRFRIPENIQNGIALDHLRLFYLMFYVILFEHGIRALLSEIGFFIEKFHTWEVCVEKCNMNEEIKSRTFYCNFEISYKMYKYTVTEGNSVLRKNNTLKFSTKIFA